MARVRDQLLDLLHEDPAGVIAALAVGSFWPELARLLCTAIVMAAGVMAP